MSSMSSDSILLQSSSSSLRDDASVTNSPRVVREATFGCGICDENYINDMKVFPCGHIVCNTCLQGLNKFSGYRKKCPYCRAVYTAQPYPLFADLHVVHDGLTMDVVMNSRQRAVHMVNALGATSSADDIRNAYNMARISRAAIRNAASSNNDLDLQNVTYAMTDAVDSLEDALQFKIQKQEMADKLQAAETQLKSIKEAYRRLQSSQSGSTSAHITLAHQVEACEAEKMALKSKLNELTADVQAMTGKLQTSENRLKALQEGYQARIESLCREVVSIRNRLDVREYAYENLSHRLRSQEELCEQATVKAKDYEEKLKDALNEKAAQMEQSKESVAKVEALQKELDTMWEVRRSLRHTNTASQKELERARVELRDADRKAALAAKLEQELTTSKRMQQSLQADLERSKAEQRALKAELEGLKSPKSPKEVEKPKRRGLFRRFTL